MDTTRRATILAVDDRPENLVALEAILNVPGYNLVKAHSGLEALRYLLTAEDVAVILLDVHMPGMDGFETAKLIKQRKKSESVPIIFLTAVGKEEGFIFEGYLVGAVDYLLKPFEPVILQAKVAIFVELYDKNKQLRVLNEKLLQEISERKGTEEALQSSEERHDTLIQNFPDGWVLLFDHALRYTIAGGAGLTDVGLSRELVEGKGLWEVWPAATCALLEPPYRAALTGITTICEIASANRIYMAHILPVRNGRGVIFAGMAVTQDITERKAVERLKNELVATVSHELRTPLASLRGFAELILTRDFSPEQQREFVTIIHAEAVRLTNLVTDFLDLQRMESGGQPYHFDRVDLEALLREAMAVFSSTDGKHTWRLTVPDFLPPVLVDADRIRQVFTNLLSNAVKFSLQGGEVTVGVRQEKTHVEVWVADQGIGIPPEALPQLFSKFFRVDSKETRSVGGTGLGLALVKEIVEAHQGRIWVESAYGRGSTFFFTLPVAAPLPQTPAAPETGRGGATDILVVEDDAAFAHLLCAYFVGEGFSVTTTEYAERAVELVRACRPRVLLVDIQLAGSMDGWDLLSVVKSDPALQDIPVMIISTSEVTNARGLALGGADYLIKPSTPTSLRQAMARLLPSLVGTHVLVVDDDVVSRRLMAGQLKAEGAQVTEATNGQEALAHLAQGMPDALLLDLLMPEMDGFELLRVLRADKRAMNLPVLVVTGKDLLASEKAYIKRKLASLVSKGEASMDYFARIVGRILALR